MKKAKENGKDAAVWMDMLAGNDGMLRQKAREALVSLGKPAVPSLVQALHPSQPDQVRWEAAKALGKIDDARSIRVLVQTLEDRDDGVAWLAADALIQFKQSAWGPLLRALIKRGAKSVSLRQGAHHVFCKQKVNGFNDVLAGLVEALERSSVPVATITAANDFLKRWNATA
jgi:HEAT repeat protein